MLRKRLFALDQMGSIMRRFAHAAVFAVAISAPVLAGALVDHSVVSVLGAPSGAGAKCGSGPCNVGGVSSGPSSGAPGAHDVFITPPESFTASGQVSTSAGPVVINKGHLTLTGAAVTPEIYSGNFETGKGHCTQNGITVACP